MRAGKLLFILVILHLSSPANSQNSFQDKQLLESRRWVSLYENVRNLNNKFTLVNTSLNYNDSVKIVIDSIDIVPCDGPSSIFFLNDSVGFLTQSGGCYAHYNFLHRTSDGGNSWVEVIHVVGADLPPSLNNDNFYMFDDTRGIIIWQIKNGYVDYSESNDGGNTWILKKAKVKPDLGAHILSIQFSVNGQITLVTGTRSMIESDKKEVCVLQSNDFGKTYRILK
jgi:hypothetical protein